MILDIDQNILLITFKKKVDYTLFAECKLSISEVNLQPVQLIQLDFSKTTFVTLAGAMYVISLVNNFKTIQERAGKRIECRITNYSDQVITSLVNFGFVKVLKSLVNLKIENWLEELNSRNMKFWSNAHKYDGELNNLYWPVSVLPLKTDDPTDHSISNLLNKFINYYVVLQENDLIHHFNVDKVASSKKFIKSVYEAIKNIWDHSESWGLCSLHSSLTNKTTFCLFDFGIGYINSFIKRKGEYPRTVERDKEILKWLFGKGNTTNEGGNFGRGLPIITDFVDTVNGVLLVKTDKYMITYRSNNLAIAESNYYPGTQIMINF